MLPPIEAAAAEAAARAATSASCARGGDGEQVEEEEERRTDDGGDDSAAGAAARRADARPSAPPDWIPLLAAFRATDAVLLCEVRCEGEGARLLARCRARSFCPRSYGWSMWVVCAHPHRPLASLPCPARLKSDVVVMRTRGHDARFTHEDLAGTRGFPGPSETVPGRAAAQGALRATERREDGRERREEKGGSDSLCFVMDMRRSETTTKAETPKKAAPHPRK